MFRQLENKRTKEYEALISLFQNIKTELGLKGDSAVSLQKETRKLLDEVKQTIPTVPDIGPIQDRLDSLDLMNMEDVSDSMPLLGEPIRDALELLPKGEKLNIEAIENLRDELDDVKKKAVIVGGGGGGFLGASHSPIHEVFTMNGTDTTVTLSSGVAAQGTALWVRYNGQMLDLTTHYTVNGTKITFTFTPEVDKTISVTYIP